MKISTKGRYGLRIVIDLATHSLERQVPLMEIAKRQDLSEIYLEQIVSTLRKAGIIKSIKGPHGGYLLALPAKEITVGMVLRALEGELSVMDDKVKEINDNISISYCIKVNVLEKIDERISELVDSVTINDLIVEHKIHSNNTAYTYEI